MQFSSLHITNKKMRCESPSKIKWDLTNGPLKEVTRAVRSSGLGVRSGTVLLVISWRISNPWMWCFKISQWRQYGKTFGGLTGSSLIKHRKYNCQKDWQSKKKIFLETVQHRFIILHEIRLNRPPPKKREHLQQLTCPWYSANFRGAS